MFLFSKNYFESLRFFVEVPCSGMAKKGQYKSGAKARSVQQRKYNSSPVQKRRRAARNLARRKAIKSGRVKKGSSKDVDHKNRRTLSYSSTQVISRKKNRAKNSPLGLKRK